MLRLLHNVLPLSDRYKLCLDRVSTSQGECAATSVSIVNLSPWRSWKTGEKGKVFTAHVYGIHIKISGARNDQQRVAPTSREISMSVVPQSRSPARAAQPRHVRSPPGAISRSAGAIGGRTGGGGDRVKRSWLPTGGNIPEVPRMQSGGMETSGMRGFTRVVTLVCSTGSSGPVLAGTLDSFPNRV